MSGPEAAPMGLSGGGEQLAIARALRGRLRQRLATFGSWMSLGDPEIAAILAASSTNFVGIDLEHTTVDLSTVQATVRVCHQYGRACLPRVPPGQMEYVKRLLDAGADGVVIPQVSRRGQIDEIVSAMRYPPAGARSFGVAAAQNYGRAFEGYAQAANDSLSLVIQIESRDAVDNVEDLVSHPAVDAVLLGPYDLSGSFGVPGKLDDPRVVKACDEVIGSCARAGISCGIHLVYPSLEEVKDHLERRLTFLVLGSDVFNLWKRAEQTDEIVRGCGFESLLS